MSISIQSTRRLLGNALSVAVLCTASAGLTQSAASAVTSQQVQQPSQPGSLFITILDGEGALNDIRTRTAREPIVEVDDENHKPVAGALVLFAMDNGGGSPFATFGGAPTFSVTTDSAGKAPAHGFTITQRKGRYQIHVHASKGPAAADAAITMSNIAAAGAGSNGAMPTAIISHKKLDWILGGVAAAGVAIGVAIVETRGSSPITVGTGTGTVGPPSVRPGIRITFPFKVH